MANDGGRAVVLGGGGVTGVAWEVGMLHGLAELGIDLSTADLFVGTSAGSVVAAQITSGTPLDELYRHELADTTGDRNASIGLGVVLRFALSMVVGGESGRRRLGRAALRAKTVPESARRKAIGARVPGDAWPATRLRIPAVEAETGRVKVFDNDSGVPLIDAVAASCAVPIVWPPMTVAGTRYIDGGARSIANVDLAKGYGRVIVLAPGTMSMWKRDRPAGQASRLGVPNAVVTPNKAAVAAIGRNPLSPDRRAAAAEAGREQATEAFATVKTVWG